MKKITLLATMLLVGASISAQNIVTEIPQYRSAVLEEYTGIHCVFCPDGHLRAKNFKAMYPGRVLLINIHEGGYANPSPGEPDFRTPYGTALANQTGLLGYPAGTMNRAIFPNINSSATALNRGDWQGAGEQIIAMPSAANIGASTTYNATTRQLTIDVEVKYVDDAVNAQFNLLNIAVLQDNVEGPQTGGSTYNPGDVLPNGKYNHGHMLRDLITGQWGDTISTTTKGSLFTKTYTYTLPDSINAIPLVDGDVHLAIYVTETRQDITQGISIGLNDLNDGNNAPIYGEISNGGSTVVDGVLSTPSNLTFDFISNINGAADFTFDLITDAPNDWTGSFKVNGTSYSSKQVVSLTGGMTNNIEISTIPGATNALSRYTLLMYPNSDSSGVIKQEFYVISGVTDLIVNGSGGFGDGKTYNFDNIYESALANTGSNAFDLTDSEVMVQAFNSNAFTGVQHIYLNIGWTFPSFNDDEAQALMAFMDNGGNVFVAGQDIGWDQNASNGYGTPVTKLMFNNYFKADYLNDGNAQNNTIGPDSTDAVFYSVASSAVIDVYGGNFYPDVIAPATGAEGAFYYGTFYTPTKSAGVRVHNGYKLVYLGIGLEMIQDAAVKDQIVGLTYQWFHGMISNEEFDFASKGFSVYPNPGNGNLTLELPVEGDFNYSVMDISGKLVQNSSFTNSGEKTQLNLSNLPKGVYMLTLEYGSKSMMRKVVIE